MPARSQPSRSWLYFAVALSLRRKSPSMVIAETSWLSPRIFEAVSAVVESRLLVTSQQSLPDTHRVDQSVERPADADEPTGTEPGVADLQIAALVLDRGYRRGDVGRAVVYRELRLAGGRDELGAEEVPRPVNQSRREGVRTSGPAGVVHLPVQTTRCQTNDHIIIVVLNATSRHAAGDDAAGVCHVAGLEPT